MDTKLWLVDYIAEAIEAAPSEIDPDVRFKDLGLTSLATTSMLAELSKQLDRVLSPTIAWEYPTPVALARHLDGAASQAITPVAAGQAGDGSQVAVVGLACRFPGAPSADAFWSLLRDGVDAIREVPADRWDIAKLFDADATAPGKMSTRWGGFLDQVDRFDPFFFGIAPREASQIDPQQRLALELSWEALEDAGMVPAGLRDSRTGVFFGAMWMDYARLLEGARDQIVQHTATGQDLSIVAARVSYTLGTVGPSLTVNTACSSSLVAVHLACQSLLRGESRLALAGGVNLILSPDSTVAMTKFGAMAPDGRSKAFDARANGYVRGEGGGVLVLKRLADAQADGDRIYCVVRGSAVNNDGFSNGLTAPSPSAQRAVLAEACERAGVSPAEVQYVEAHGTGTMLGDPIEANALGAVYGAGRPAARALRIGSVKSNIGHLEAAAGMAGLIKVALSMEHGELPRSLHFQRPNPHIDFPALRVAVQQAHAPWTAENGRLLAGVSSFGFGGTNSHVILERATEAEPRLFVLSAADEPSLRLAAASAALAQDGSLAEMCRQAALRPREEYRLAAVARSREELAGLLQSYAGGRTLPGLTAGRAGQPPRVAMLFTGQGSQWLGMGRGLYRAEPVFRSALDRCAVLFDQGADLLEVMWSGGDLLHRTQFTQPALFALEFALAELWKSYGVEPAAVLGHSIGELAAACVAGVLSLPDAVKLVAARGRLMGALPAGGAMVAIAAREDEVLARAAPFAATVSVAAVNARESVVLSGAEEPVLAIAATFAAEGVSTRRLAVSHAFHSPLMAPMREEFGAVAASLTYRPARFSLVSSLSGAVEAAPGADHWVRHIEAKVRFADGLEATLALGADVLLEVGPHPVLLELAPGTAERIPSMERGLDEQATMLAALGRLFVAGAPVRLAPDETAAHLFVVSAKSEEALRAQRDELRQHLAAHPGQSLRDVAYSLATHRTAFEHRLAVVARSREDLDAELASAEPIQRSRGKTAFVFSGQGSQLPGMGRELYAAWPVFRDALDEALACFDEGLREAMWGTAAGSLLDQTAWTQPALFSLQYALVQLWRSWGVEPQLLAGHSIGELTAACVAGVFTLQDAAALVAARGRLMQALPAGGAMLSAAASEAEAASWLEGDLEIAAVNGPAQVVLAGSESAIAAVREKLSARKVRTTPLAVSHAFHSARMDPMLEAFAEVARSVRLRAPSLPMVSNVTGKLAGDEIATPDYWVRHVRRAVRFGDGVRALTEAGASAFVEIGPRATLLGLLPASARCTASLRQGKSETETMLSALGAHWTGGGEVKWPAVFTSGGARAGLPAYAWQRERYWLAPALKQSGQPTGHPLLGSKLSAAGHAGLYETLLGLESHPWLGDHRVFGKVVVPGAAIAELFRAAGADASGAPV
ncbi:MAG TPA: acyltransferase domain-containing protein, partial [Myxococcales bacterium]|nr:acyltransferase domain-containing protein [Myxococcales bacterium]